MKALGFSFTKNDFRYGVLEGDPAAPTLIDKGKHSYPNNMDTPQFMGWMETQLMLLVDKHSPDQLSHKISLNLDTLDQVRQSCYPQAILNLIAQKKNLLIKAYSTQAINATKFGKPKSTDVYAYVDTILGTHPPYWNDKPTKEAILVAWFNLL